MQITYKCGKCGSQDLELRGPNKDHYHCQSCGQTSRDSIAWAEEATRKLTCPDCGSTNVELYARTKVIGSDEPDPFRCLACDSFFRADAFARRLEAAGVSCWTQDATEKVLDAMFGFDKELEVFTQRILTGLGIPEDFLLVVDSLSAVDTEDQS